MLGKWNATGLSILRNMNQHWSVANRAMERLSSGYRINRAADDPAGLAISEKMRAQIRGLGQAYSRWDFAVADSRRGTK